MHNFRFRNDSSLSLKASVNSMPFNSCVYFFYKTITDRLIDLKFGGITLRHKCIDCGKFHGNRRRVLRENYKQTETTPTISAHFLSSYNFNIAWQKFIVDSKRDAECKSVEDF